MRREAFVKAQNMGIFNSEFKGVLPKVKNVSNYGKSKVVTFLIENQIFPLNIFAQNKTKFMC